MRKFLFQGDDATKLKNLQNTLAFAQGDLSRLPGLPGGIFIHQQAGGSWSNNIAVRTSWNYWGCWCIRRISPRGWYIICSAVASKITANLNFQI